jgi:cobalt-zinc-cadmium efflux system outer membrane protein
MFYSALSAQQAVAVRARLLAVAHDAVDTAQQLANVGQADAPDVLQAQVEADQADIDYAAAQNAFVEHFRQLAAVSGSPETLMAPLDGNLETLPEVDAEHAVQSMVDQSPLVREAQHNVLVAEARVKQAKREIVPDLQLKAGEQVNREALGGSPGRQTGAQSFASASLDLPLWNRNQGNVRAAEIELEQAREEVRRTQLAVREDGEGLAERYTSAKMEAARYRTSVLPKARRAYELYQEKYQSMAQAYPLVLVSQRTLFELEMRSIDALDRAWQNAIALENFGLRDGLGKLPSDH